MALAVAALQSVDVTKDGVADLIALVGEQENGSELWKNLRLVIQNGASGVINAIDLPSPEGYSPTLFVGAFTMPGAQNILVSVPVGGSGGIINYSIFNYDNAIIETLFTSEDYNSNYSYIVQYGENYQVVATSLINSQSYRIDLTGKGDVYLNSLYNSNGTLRSFTEGYVNPLSGLYPVDFNGDGVYSLLGYQEVTGTSNADTLGYFLNTLQWRGASFVLTDQLLGLIGTPLTPIQPR